ncbi:MAG: CocE/NonD family hydrolase [Alphaproteobacteria bacterium]|nr:CocE/NonD family hydrolase [Alphaproteobacteria bacterium]
MAGIEPRKLPVAVEHDLQCVCRDGTILRADVYHPADGGRYPALLNRTPYGKREPRYIADAREVASRGYTVIVQDQRGRYASDGEYRWMFRERTETFDVEDGYDAAQWASTLPWSDGRLGTWGHSNASYLAWMLASSRPPALKAIMASGMAQNLLSMNFGIFETGRRLEWVHLMAADARRRAGDPGPHSAAEATEHWNTIERGKYIWWVPLGDIPAHVFSTLHGPLQTYHRAQNREFMRFGEFHSQITAPVMLMTGWWDRLIGTMDHYTGLATDGPRELRRQHRLIVGPWIHDVTQLVPKNCGMDFGPEAERSYADMIARWYDYHLKGKDDGIGSEEPVQLFVLGRNKWRGETEWPLSRARPTALYLHSGGRANTVRGDGVLAPWRPAHDEASDRFDYDPRDPVMSLMRADSQAAPVDQAPHDHRSDILVYQTAPLAQEIEAIGPVSLRLWAATDGPDTDWTAKLAVVQADGRCFNLTYGIMRAQYRDGYDRPKLLEPGNIYEYAIALNPIAIVFKKGQRIRLYISSSDFPNFDRNHNTGSDYWSDPVLRVAQQAVFHDRARASCLTLPIIPSE